MSTKTEYKSFEEFYPFYLSQHQNPTCRKLHVIGTALGLLLTSYCLAFGQYATIALAPVIGYGFSWVGHFVFEKNRPATFQYPRYSFMGDFRMLYEVVTGKLKN